MQAQDTDLIDLPLNIVRDHIDDTPMIFNFSRAAEGTIAHLEIGVSNPIVIHFHHFIVDVSEDTGGWLELGRRIVDNTAKNGLSLSFEWNEHRNDPPTCSYNVKAFFLEVVKCLNIKFLRLHGISSDDSLRCFPLATFTATRNWARPKEIQISMSRESSEQEGLTEDGGLWLANVIDTCDSAGRVVLKGFTFNSVPALKKLMEVCKKRRVLSMSRMRVPTDTYYELLRDSDRSCCLINEIQLVTTPVSDPHTVVEAAKVLSMLKFNSSVESLTLRTTESGVRALSLPVMFHLSQFARVLINARSIESLVHYSNHSLKVVTFEDILSGREYSLEFGMPYLLNPSLSISDVFECNQLACHVDKLLSKINLVLSQPTMFANLENSTVASELFHNVPTSALPHLLGWKLTSQQVTSTQSKSAHRLGFMYNVLKNCNKSWADRNPPLYPKLQCMKQLCRKRTHCALLLPYTFKAPRRIERRTKMYTLLWLQDDESVQKVHYSILDTEPLTYIVDHFSLSMGHNRDCVKLYFRGEEVNHELCFIEFATDVRVRWITLHVKICCGRIRCKVDTSNIT